MICGYIVSIAFDHASRYRCENGSRRQHILDGMLVE